MCWYLRLTQHAGRPTVESAAVTRLTRLLAACLWLPALIWAGYWGLRWWGIEQDVSLFTVFLTTQMAGLSYLVTKYHL